MAALQAPGRIVADTKHDLTGDPIGFLAQALTPWSEIMPLGQLQNQAYGYLFPQGAFFAAGQVLHIPATVTQGVWWALTLCLAFTGAYRLAEAAGVGTHPTRILAGLLYAVGPRMVTTVAAISSEAWAVALAPWIAVPLVRLLRAEPGTTTRGQVIRAALSSAVAVLMTGAVNATSTAAACIVGGLFALSAGVFGPARARAWGLLAAWLPAVVAVSIWWLVPLLLMGRYSPPFTDYIESAGVTTRWMSLTEVLRGTTSWAPFVSVEREGGHALVVEPVFIIATMAVAAIGIAGLAMRSMPGRRTWWFIGAVGIALMAAWTYPFAPLNGPGRAFLDGAGAALRNVHKFDSVWRLPLIMGVAHLATRVLPTGRGELLHPEKHPRAVGAMALAVITVVATAPAWTGRLAAGEPFTEVPGYWAEAASWLTEHDDGSRTLVEPAAPFGDQEWGFTRDEPLQPLAEVPWAVRDAIPLVPPEAIRGLDGVQDALHTGRGVPTLAATLRAQGVGRILVKRDARDTGRTSDPRALQRTLSNSPGLTKAASFGEPGEPGGGLDIWTVDGSRDALAPRIADVATLPWVAGGPEVLTRLDAIDGSASKRLLVQDATDALPGLIASSPGVVPGPLPVTVTDTPAVRSRNYGEVTGAVTAIRPADEDPLVANPVPDYPVAGAALTAIESGGGTVTASSESDDPYAFGGADSAHPVTAAVDGDPETWWQPARGQGQGEHIDITLPGAVKLGQVRIIGARVPSRVQVETDAASTSTQILPGETAHLPIPGGPTRHLRLTATQAPLGVGIAELRIIDAAGRDITPTRVAVVPPAPEGTRPWRWVLGQEIREGVLHRIIDVPSAVTVRIDSAACHRGRESSGVTVDGGDLLDCGAELALTPGRHHVATPETWTSLTDVSALPVVPVTGDALDDAQVAASPAPRVIWRPVSANDGLRATVGGRELTPTLVDGWQQAWIVPAGVSGEFHLEFTATGAWRGGIIGGGVLAALVLLGTLVVRRRVREARPAPNTPADLPAAMAPVVTTVLAVLVAGWPGFLVTVAVQVATAGLARVLGRRRPESAPGLPGWLAIAAGTVTGVAGVVASWEPWPGSGYLAATWGVQLLLVAALSLVGAAQTRPMKRRAGSSTSA